VRVRDGRLRVIAGEVAARPEVIDPGRFQADCVKAFVASWTARGFSSSTIDNDIGVLADAGRAGAAGVGSHYG
jgi:integrase/recombinase XerD